jgi:hypothetical protein
MKFYTKWMVTSVAAIFLAAVRLSPLWGKPNVAGLAHQCDVLGKQNACQELAKLAEHDKDTAVRLLAIGSLTNQMLLAKLAVGDPNENVRWTAVDRLTDQMLLAEIAVKDASARVRKVAVQKLTDRTVLAKLASGKSDESSVAGDAATRLRDLEVADNVRANWPKLRARMPLSEVEKLIGPVPTPTVNEMSSTTDALTGRMTFTSRGWAKTDLYLLRFENNELTEWEFLGPRATPEGQIAGRRATLSTTQTPNATNRPTAILYANQAFLVLESNDGRNIVILRAALVDSLITSTSDSFEHTAATTAGILFTVRGGTSVNKSVAAAAGDEVARKATVNRFLRISEFLGEHPKPASYDHLKTGQP